MKYLSTCKNDYSKYILKLKKSGIECYFFHRVAMKNHLYYNKEAVKRIINGVSFPVIANYIEKYENEFMSITKGRYLVEDITKLANIPPIIQIGDKFQHDSLVSEYVNVHCGERETKHQPKEYKLTIHMYGRCGIFGYAVKDSETVPSYLQQKINAQNLSIKVVNHGLWGADDKYILSNFMVDVEEGIIKSGDIVIFYMHELEKKYMNQAVDSGLKYYNITEKFHFYADSRDCFYDKPGHMTAEGYKIVSDLIFDYIFNDLSYVKKKLTACPNIQHERSVIKGIPDNLMKYIEKIKEISGENDSDSKIGCIVMNCNPFTFGHRYLIEYACGFVDRLIIFVVQEDKSEFTFQERFFLVKQGTKDLSSVIVVPSGNYIISSITFPEYFIKGKNNLISVDTSKDLEFFCNFIAPGLNITYRFIGEEPIDYVTKQYNENMKKMLPNFGIEIIEIPRKEFEKGQVISASKVRLCLQSNDWDTLQILVPETTFEYLKKRINNKPYFSLKNGLKVPAIGLGTYSVVDNIESFSMDAYVNGYLSLERTLISHFFLCLTITTPDILFSFEQIINNRMKQLEQKRIDLLLINYDCPLVCQALWSELEIIYQKGICKAIGVRNFDIKSLKRLSQKSEIQPFVNQIELHPMHQQKKICKYCQLNGIQIMAYSPLANMDKKLIENEILVKLAEKYQKTVPQIIIRWDIQHGYIPIIDKNEGENTISNICDFTLSFEDMELIDSLDCEMQTALKIDNSVKMCLKIKCYILIGTYFLKKYFKENIKKIIKKYKVIWKLYIDPKYY